MILTTAARNAACNAVVDLLDAGTGAAYIEMQTSGDVEVATLPMSDPAFGNAATGVATAGAITTDTNATGGTIEHAKFFDSDDAEVFEMSVGTSGAEINLSSIVIGSGDSVALSACTVTCPAGT